MKIMKIALYAPNGRKVFTKAIDEDTILLSERKLSYLLGGLQGENQYFFINSPCGRCVNVAGYRGGNDHKTHEFHIEESYGFFWVIIPGPRTTRMLRRPADSRPRVRA